MTPLASDGRCGRCSCCRVVGEDVSNAKLCAGDDGGDHGDTTISGVDGGVVPSPWVAVFSEVAHRVFYFNAHTKIGTFEPPFQRSHPKDDRARVHLEGERRRRRVDGNGDDTEDAARDGMLKRARGDEVVGSDTATVSRDSSRFHLLHTSAHYSTPAASRGLPPTPYSRDSSRQGASDDTGVGARLSCEEQGSTVTSQRADGAREVVPGELERVSDSEDSEVCLRVSTSRYSP